MGWNESLATQNLAYDALQFNGLTSPYQTVNAFAPTGQVVQAGLPMDPVMFAQRTGIGRVSTGTFGQAFATADVALASRAPVTVTPTTDVPLLEWLRQRRSDAIPLEYLSEMTVQGVRVETAISVGQLPPNWFVVTEGPAAISGPDGSLRLVPIGAVGGIVGSELPYPLLPDLPFWP